MANYYKNDISISTIVKCITNSTVNACFVGSGQITLTTTYTSTFSARVNEKPSELSYQYQGTDISTYCIAPYVESSGSTAFTSVPSWCTKIRSVLIGGGGGGGRGGTQYNVDLNEHYIIRYELFDLVYYQHQQVHHDFYVDPGPPLQINPAVQQDQTTAQQNIQYQPQYFHRDQNQHFNGQSGGGGGGGGYVYLNTYQIGTGYASVSVQLGTGGAGADSVTTSKGNAGGGTVLTLPGSVTITAGGGAGGQTGGQASSSADGSGGGNVGSGGTVQTGGVQLTTGDYKNGNAGQTTTGGTSGFAGSAYTTTTFDGYGYGDGNDGGATAGSIAGTTGNNGYYRIYFLT